MNWLIFWPDKSFASLALVWTFVSKYFYITKKIEWRFFQFWKGSDFLKIYPKLMNSSGTNTKGPDCISGFAEKNRMMTHIVPPASTFSCFYFMSPFSWLKAFLLSLTPDGKKFHFFWLSRKKTIAIFIIRGELLLRPFTFLEICISSPPQKKKKRKRQLAWACRFWGFHRESNLVFWKSRASIKSFNSWDFKKKKICT